MSANQKHIIILEDDPMIRRMLKPLFEDKYRLDMYSSGEDLLNHLEAPPDLLVLDHYLGGDESKMSGLQVLQALRKDFPSMPAILLSGCHEQEVIMEYNKLNIADFIGKGNGFHEQLASKADRLLGNG